MPICLENETEHSVHDVGCPLSHRTLAMLLCMNINALCKIRDLSWNLKSFTHTHKRIYDMVKLKINYMAILNLVRRHIPVVLIAMTVIFFFGVTVYCWLVASLDRTWSILCPKWKNWTWPMCGLYKTQLVKQWSDWVANTIIFGVDKAISKSF